MLACVVLKGATLYDGTLNPGKVGDIAIKGDRIVAVGKFKTKGNPRVLDCEGLVISPGFIDLHTHSDYPLQAAKTNATALKTAAARTKRSMRSQTPGRRAHAAMPVSP